MGVQIVQSTPTQVLCPWSFLDGLIENKNGCDKVGESFSKEVNVQVTTQEGLKKISFAQALVGVSQLEKKESFLEKLKDDQPQHINIADLPNPSTKGNIPSIKLAAKAIERGKLYCKYCLVGRLDFLKISIDKVRTKAEELWHPKGDWKIIPLGKGFFMLRLSCEEELVRIWTGGPWRIENQLLRLTRWTPDFDPDQKRSSKSLVWIKFPKLGQQYWDYEILMSLGKCVGDPIGVDKHTLDRDFGYFASVLVEVDLSNPLPTQIVIEEEGGMEFIQALEIPNLPKFCSHCKALGHSIHECKGLHKVIRIEDENKKLNNAFVNRKKNQSKKMNKEDGVSGMKDHTSVPIVSLSDEEAEEDEVIHNEVDKPIENVS